MIRKLCEYKGVEIIEAEACKDHIHMLISMPPKYSVSQFMGYLKGKSSLLLSTSMKAAWKAQPRQKSPLRWQNRVSNLQWGTISGLPVLSAASSEMRNTAVMLWCRKLIPRIFAPINPSKTQIWICISRKITTQRLSKKRIGSRYKGCCQSGTAQQNEQHCAVWAITSSHTA